VWLHQSHIIFLGVPADILIALLIGSSASITANFGAKYGKKQEAYKLTTYFGFLAIFVSVVVISLMIYKKEHYKKEREEKDSNLKYFYFIMAGIKL